MLAEIDVGRLIAGKYELVRLIGKGAMGEVWLATHNSLGGEFAIKLVKPSDDEEDESAAGRFQLEAQISAKLSRRTRHIISVSDHGEEDGLAYLVMELLEGESLEGRIGRTGELSLEETVAIVMQIARALGHAHAESIFHRDLKPANVFLTKDEDGRLLVKLLDFGIARSQKPFRTRSPVMTGKDMVLGTPSYMSPEQARGLDSLDHRCDLWALAVCAYESLTRHIPWEGESVEDIFLSICTHRVVPILARRPELPLALEEVFVKSFTEKLELRFRTAAELSEAFEVLVDPLAVEAAMGSVPKPPSARRLPAASDHDIASAMAMGRPPEMRTDPSGIAAGGGPTEFMRRQKRSSGWLLAAIAGLVTIGVIVFGLRAFTSRDTASSPPTNPPASTVATTAPPPSDPVPPPTTATPTATATPATTMTAAKGAARPSAKVGPPPVVAAPPPPPKTAASIVTAPPPPVQVQVPAAPATTARPERDKSGVF